MTIPVSICLVTYNRAALLPATIDSLLNQTFQDFELIISDDCSSDETKDVCQAYAARDSRIRYMRNNVNLNMPGNLNVSLQAASGEYLANLHDGDIYYPSFIEKCKKALDNFPTAGFVFNGYHARKNDGEILTFLENYPSLIPGWQLGQRLLSRWDSCVYGTVVARREVYENIGWFEPQFGNYGDVDMWMRIAREYDVAYIREPLISLMPQDPSRFYYRVHWKVVFWLLGMHTVNLRRYATILPDVAAELAATYPSRRRELFLKYVKGCLKNRQWRQLREMLAIWQDADDPYFRLIGRVFGRPGDQPEWYGKAFWEMAAVPSALAAEAASLSYFHAVGSLDHGPTPTAAARDPDVEMPTLSVLGREQ